MSGSWHLTLPGMAVQFPKFVRITNTRIWLFQTILQVCVVGVLFYFFWAQQEYLEFSYPEGDPNNWAESPTLETWDAAVREDYKKDFCQYPADTLSYKFSDNWTYEKFQCLEMTKSEMSFKIGKRIIYFPTYFHEEWMKSAKDLTEESTTCQDEIISLAPTKCQSGAPPYDECHETKPCIGGCIRSCTSKRRRHYFTVGVEEMGMAFENNYRVPELDRGGGSSHPVPEAGEDKDSMEEPMLTIIYRKDGSEYDCGKPSSGYCRFDPGNNVSLKVGQWLEAAGFKLDKQNESTVKNKWSGVTLKDYPIYRITGADIEISAAYIDATIHRVESPVHHPPGENERWGHTLCKIKVLGKDNWTGLPINRYEKLDEAGGSESSSLRYRYYEGVRFEFTTATSGKFAESSVQQWITFFTSLAVFVGLVTKVAMVVCIYLLGNTSRTYMRAVREPLDARQASTEALPSKLVSATAAFYMLASLERMGEKGKSMMIESDANGIKKETFRLALEHVFNNRPSLDMEERNVMAEHAWRKLSKCGQVITLSDFVSAVGSNEVFDPHAMIQTFDTDRRRGPLEILFDDGSSKPRKLKEFEPTYEYALGGFLRRTSNRRNSGGDTKPSQGQNQSDHGAHQELWGESSPAAVSAQPKWTDTGLRNA